MSTPESQAMFCLVNIKVSSDLAKALGRLAAKFPLGGSEVKIDLDSKLAPVGLVTEIKLHAAAAARLGRQENVIECASAPLKMSAATRRRIYSYLKRVSVPQKVSDASTFFLVIVRRRDLRPGATGKFDLSKKVPIANEVGFILGLTSDQKKLIATVIHTDYYVRGVRKKGGATIVTLPQCGSGSTTSGGDTADVGDSGAQTQPQPDPDNLQDFVKCYTDCLADVPPYLITLSAVACASCSTALIIAATTGGGAGITALGLAIACTACAVAVGAILGNCLLNCVEES
jgi:hypothetical protein